MKSEAKIRFGVKLGLHVWKSGFMSGRVDCVVSPCVVCVPVDCRLFVVSGCPFCITLL